MDINEKVALAPWHCSGLDTDLKLEISYTYRQCQKINPEFKSLESVALKIILTTFLRIWVVKRTD